MSRARACGEIEETSRAARAACDGISLKGLEFCGVLSRRDVRMANFLGKDLVVLGVGGERKI